MKIYNLLYRLCVMLINKIKNGKGLIVLTTMLFSPLLVAGQVGAGGSSGDSIWTEKGNRIHNLDMNSDVGIGTYSPTHRLDVAGDARIRGLSGKELSLVGVKPDGALHRLSDKAIKNIISDIDGIGDIGNGRDPSNFHECILKTTGGPPPKPVYWRQGESNHSAYLCPLKHKVGIGLADPKKSLHIYSQEGLDKLAGSKKGIRLSHEVKESGNQEISTWDIEPTVNPTNSEPPKLFVGPPSKTVMTLAETGNVGIGITNPDDQLELDGSIDLRDNDGSGNNNIKNVNTVNVRNFTSNRSTNPIHFKQSFIVEAGAGKVGIGTNSPDKKLDVKGKAVIDDKLMVGINSVPDPFIMGVDGKILCEKVRVKDSDNWPDYVGNSDYNPMPFKKKIEYFKKHQHLPEIPSKEELKKNGRDLGDIQTAQMKSIEELYLYMDEMKKELKELKKENEKLRKRLNKQDK